jgi:hypothetical protein
VQVDWDSDMIGLEGLKTAVAGATVTLDSAVTGRHLYRMSFAKPLPPGALILGYLEGSLNGATAYGAVDTALRARIVEINGEAQSLDDADWGADQSLAVAVAPGDVDGDGAVTPGDAALLESLQQTPFASLPQWRLLDTDLLRAPDPVVVPPVSGEGPDITPRPVAPVGPVDLSPIESPVLRGAPRFGGPIERGALEGAPTGGAVSASEVPGVGQLLAASFEAGGEGGYLRNSGSSSLVNVCLVAPQTGAEGAESAAARFCFRAQIADVLVLPDEWRLTEAEAVTADSEEAEAQARLGIATVTGEDRDRICIVTEAPEEFASNALFGTRLGQSAVVAGRQDAATGPTTLQRLCFEAAPGERAELIEMPLLPEEQAALDRPAEAATLSKVVMASAALAALAATPKPRAGARAAKQSHLLDPESP